MTRDEHNANMRRGVNALKYAMRKHGFPKVWELGGGRDASGLETPYYVKVESYRYTGTTVDAAVLHAVADQTARAVALP